jgi:hypothetical protein
MLCTVISICYFDKVWGEEMCETCSMNARQEERMQQYFEVVKGRDQNCVKRMLNCTLKKLNKRQQI